MARPRQSIHKENITVRIEPEKRAVLDQIAQHYERDRSFVVNEAIDALIARYEWEVAHIKEGLRQVEAGEVVSHEEVRAEWQALVDHHME